MVKNGEEKSEYGKQGLLHLRIHDMQLPASAAQPLASARRNAWRRRQSFGPRERRRIDTARRRMGSSMRQHAPPYCECRKLGAVAGGHLGAATHANGGRLQLRRLTGHSRK
jgi:hypothetical protein